MADIRVEKLADVLVNYSVGVKRGDKVAVSSTSLADPLLKEIYRSVLQAGGHPLLMANPPWQNEMFFRYASDEQLQFIGPVNKMVTETYDVNISIMATENTKAMQGVPPEKMTMQRRASAEIMQTYMQRSAKGELRWTVSLFPTQAFAQEAGMSLAEYEDFVYQACLPDMDDPVGYWKHFSARQQKVVDWLKGKQQVHLIGRETDLRLSIAGRSFINCDGKVNLPDGEVFTGPVEDSMQGQVYFSYPAIFQGREVTGVRLKFEAGKVVEAHADKGEDFLLRTLDTDEGSHRVGEFAIGTNEGIQRFTHNILFDEKIGGSFHMALGAGYPETGSTNVSSLHWDMICDLRDGGEIWVDDQLLYKNGRFVIDL